MNDHSCPGRIKRLPINFDTNRKGCAMQLYNMILTQRAKVLMGFLSAFCLLLPLNDLFGQTKPMTLDEIALSLQKLKKKQSQSKIIDQIVMLKVDFELTEAAIIRLAHLDASDELIKAIKENRLTNYLVIKFTDLRLFGDTVRMSLLENETKIRVIGNSSSYPGFTICGDWKIDKRRSVCVKIEESATSIFSNHQRMLKVFVSNYDRPLRCTTESILASEDKEFIVKGDGEFHYVIPEELVKDGKLTKIGFSFGPGEYNGLKMSAWFE
jgi:hypothetical protein